MRQIGDEPIADSVERLLARSKEIKTRYLANWGGSVGLEREQGFDDGFKAAMRMLLGLESDLL